MRVSKHMIGGGYVCEQEYDWWRLRVCASIQLVVVTCVSEHMVEVERGLVAVTCVSKRTIGGSYVCEQAYDRGGEGIGGGYVCAQVYDWWQLCM